MIKIKNVSRYYYQGKKKEIVIKALENINLEIHKGEFTALVGPSGSGKTTLLNLIGALDLPTQGSIWIDDKDITKLKESERAKFRLYSIGFVFQSYNLISTLTALENIEYVLMLRKIPASIRKEKALSILKEIGLEGLANRFPIDMSGGQQQRVAVGRALVGEPKIILADEPTANLDGKTASQLLDLMEDMCNKKQITFLFSTHDPRVMQRAKRIITLEDGKIKNDQNQGFD
ncbi:MAG: ABC transporter ATP-binding protein [Leptospiraceae bacterium]|nr:MAG: ABC transporter ATP-binding protein [Leptospiraceae bacterium]